MADMVRWNPFDELMSWWPRDLLARLQPGGAAALPWSPRCDVKETESEIVVSAELPGVARSDMEVTVRDGLLTLRGEKRSEHTEAEGTKAYTERFFGTFERSLSIPAYVEQEAIEASLCDGVLTVRIPKRKPEEPPVRKIEIRAPQ